MSSTPSVAAVIPAYNSARLLPRCIGSALAQTVPLAEILVIDDGSSDNPGAVVSQFPAPVRLIQQKNGGVAVARNTGIRAASSTWIAFLDADDHWLPEKTERQLECAARHPEAAVIYSDATIVEIDGTHVGSFLADKGPRSGNVYDRLLESFFILPSTALVRRDVLVACGMFSETLRKMEDYDLWIRLAREYEFQLVPEALTLYERQPNSSSKDVLGTAKSQCVLLKSLLDHDLNPVQMRKMRRRLAGSLFDVAYELRRTNPRASIPFAWESLTTHPSRVKSWELMMKCLLTSLFHTAR